MIDLSMHLPIVLLMIRGICHFLIFLRIVTYKTKSQCRHRQVVGWVAAIFAGLNIAESVRIANSLTTDMNHDPYLPGLMLFVLAFVYWTDGNIAKLFPQKLLERLP